LRFAHYTNYQQDTRAGLRVNPGEKAQGLAGGVLEVLGESDNLVKFTSARKIKGKYRGINGDWAGINGEIPDGWDPKNWNGPTLNIKGAIVEYTSDFGIQILRGDLDLSYSIIRWVNDEGVYCEGSKVTIDHCYFYQCGNNLIALEKSNKDVLIQNSSFFQSGSAINMVDGSKNHEAWIKNNHFFWLSDKHPVRIHNAKGGAIGNEFLTSGTEESAITIVMDRDGYKEGQFESSFDKAKHGSEANTFVHFTGPPSTIGDMPKHRGFDIPEKYNLGYRPGTQKDLYQYVYSQSDKTRVVIGRLGKGMGHAWAVTFDGKYICRNYRLGFARLSRTPGVGIVERYLEYGWSADKGNIVPMQEQIQALTYDGSYYWADVFNPDFGATIVRYMLIPGKVTIKKKVEDSSGKKKDVLVTYAGILFPITYFTVGQSVDYKSIASDPVKKKLFLVSTGGKQIYQYSIPAPSFVPGKVLNLKRDTIIDVKGGHIIGSLCRTPERPGGSQRWPPGFWCRFNNGTTREIVKLSLSGNVLGSIYPPAEKVWGLTHDGKYLYAAARTHEVFNDKKIFVLDTYLEKIYRPPFLGTDPGIMQKRSVPSPSEHDASRIVLPTIQEHGHERSEQLYDHGPTQDDLEPGIAVSAEEFIEGLDLEQVLSPSTNPEYSTKWETLSGGEDESAEELAFNTGAELGTTLSSSTRLASEYEEEMGDGTEMIPAYQVDPDSVTPDTMSENSAMSVIEDDRSGGISEVMSD